MDYTPSHPVVESDADTTEQSKLHQPKLRRPRLEGRFISFEGIDGVGKSSALARLSARLVALEYDVVTTAEPYGSALGLAVSHLLGLQAEADSVSPFISPSSVACLFLAARLQHLEQVINPALQAGKVVLCDRFHHSTLAYQGAEVEGLETLTQWAAQQPHWRMPDCTIWLNASIETSLNRLQQRGEQQTMHEVHSQIPTPPQSDPFEKRGKDYLQAVDAAYQRLSTNPEQHLMSVSAEGSAEQVDQSIWKVLTNTFSTEG